MLAYIKSIHQGGGFKLDDKSATGTVNIIQELPGSVSRPLGDYGFNHGEFFKVLSPGKYRFNILVDGESRRRYFDITVEEDMVYADGNYIQL